MSKSTKDTIEIFIDLIKKGLCPDDSLDVEHVLRGYNIKEISPNIFIISIERHPHLFGKSTKGMSSSAFATIERKYKLKIDKKVIEFVGEDVVDIDIDYDSMADEEDLSLLENNYDDENERELSSLTLKEDAKKFAIKYFESFDYEQLFDVLFISDYDLPSDFNQKLFEAIKEALIYEILEKWEWLKDNYCEEEDD